MRAMILAAGLGTRLRPLTFVRPKALVPVMGMPVLDFWVSRLHEFGIESVIINAFHLHEKLIAAVRDRKWPIPVFVQVEHEILGTGGGIANVLEFFEDRSFVVVNADIICDARLDRLHRLHVQSESPVSLLMHDFHPFNNVAVKNRERVLEFGEAARRLADNGSCIDLMAFTGIHFINAEALAHVPRGSFSDIISIYRQLILNGRHLNVLYQTGLFWREMGSLKSYMDVHRELSTLEGFFLRPLPTGNSFVIHPEAKVEPDVVLKGFVTVGKGCHLHQGALVENSILWDDVQVSFKGSLCNCIAADGVRVEGRHENEILIGDRE